MSFAAVLRTGVFYEGRGLVLCGRDGLTDRLVASRPVGRQPPRLFAVTERVGRQSEFRRPKSDGVQQKPLSPSPMTRRVRSSFLPLSALHGLLPRRSIYDIAISRVCRAIASCRYIRKSGYSRERNRRVKNKSRKCFIPM